eukprot:TRINITY_DN34133_c0_g2_i1.p1 TRINITY_DN34133_c0_g2~~TRINITY_DN34133_c0_g2_i1.p1  ORF type:complete len:117 (-),score=30.83 TRINITY_DN34133_c0_g2_i1:84-434(-)
MSSRYGAASPASPGVGGASQSSSHVDATSLQQHLYDEGGYALPNPRSVNKAKHGSGGGGSMGLMGRKLGNFFNNSITPLMGRPAGQVQAVPLDADDDTDDWDMICLLYTSPSPRDS